MDILNYKTHAFIRNLDYSQYGNDNEKVNNELTELIKKLAQIYKLSIPETLANSNKIKISREVIKISNGKITQGAKTLRYPESQFEVIYFNKIPHASRDFYVSFSTIEIVAKRCHKFKVKHNLLSRLHLEEGYAISITPKVYYKLELSDDFKGSGEIEIIWVGCF